MQKDEGILIEKKILMIASYLDIFLQQPPNLASLQRCIMNRFYTHLVESNKMDDKPFFEFRVDDIDIF